MVSLFLLLAAGVASWGFLTESGSRFTLDRIQHSFNDIQYEFTAGNLATGLSLKNVSWQLKNKTTVTINELTMTWNPWCWRARQVCLKHASADELSIVLVRPRIIRNPIVPKTILLPAGLTAKQASVNRLIIKRPDRPAISLSNLEFSGDLEKSNIVAKSLTANWLGATATVSGKIRLEGNYPLTATGIFSMPAIGRESATGSISLNGDLLNTDVMLNLHQPLHATINARLSPLNRRLPVDLTATWADGTVPFNSVNPALHLRDGRLNISGFKPNYSLIGNAIVDARDLPGAQASLHGTVNTEKLFVDQLKLVTLGGEVNIKGSVGFREKLNWHSDIDIKDISPSSYWSVPETTLSGKMIFNGVKSSAETELNFLALDISGSSGNYPFIVTGDASTNMSGAWEFNKLNIESSRNSVKAEGVLSKNSDLSLHFALREPGMFRSDLKGDIFGDFKITGSRKLPDISGIVRSRQLLFKNLRANNTRFDTDISAGGTEPGSIKLTTDSVDMSGNSLNNVNLSITGTRHSHSISAGFKSEFAEVENTRLNGALDEHYNWAGKLLSVTGNIEGNSLNLINAFDLTWVREKKSIAIEPNCWSVSGTYACIDKPALLGKDGTVSFNLKGLDLAAVKPLIPDDIKVNGLLHSKGRVHWTAFGKPSARVTARVENGSVTASLPSAEKPLNLTLENANLSIYTTRRSIKSRLNIVTDKIGEIEASASIDLRSRRYPIRGALTLGNTDLNLLANYYPESGVKNGIITGRLNTTGTLRKPEIKGNLQLRGAAYAVDKLPIPLNKIKLDVDIAGKEITLNGSAQSDGNPVNLHGSATYSSETWSANLTANARDLKVEHDYIKSAVVSPDLAISITPKQTLVTGDITLTNASIDIPKLENTGVPLSSDIVVIDAVEKPAGTLNTLAHHAVAANLNIRLGQHVYFTGYGLNAELSGGTNIKLKPQRTPELVGVVNVQNGTYRSYGQSLIIREGRISFVGPIEQTALSVEAVRNAGNVLAGIRIEGSLNNPETTLFSDPPMPEEHILPYVVLGRPLDIGGTTDDSQLLTNAAIFMGISNGRNLTRDIAADLGIDDFTMNATGSGEDTQVLLSGRINDRLLVRYGLGIFNSVNTLFLRYDLAEKLYLETTQGLEKAVDVFYSFEFD